MIDDDDDAAMIDDAMMDHPMWDPLVELVALAATYDQRKAGRLDVKAWFLVAQVERWHVPAVQRVIVEHYARTTARLTPAGVSQRLRELRSAIAEQFEPPRIPEGLPDHDYPAWYQAQMAAHRARGLDRWAATGEEPRPAFEARGAATLGELIANAPDHVRPDLKAAAVAIEARRP